MGILLTLLILSLVVVVHEYGHYLLMRRNGVKVIEFTIGFGPTLWETKLKSGTMFRIKPILLGGYARPVTEGEGAIGDASGWAKFKIYMAGMFMNATVAFLVFSVIFMIVGGIPVQLAPYIRPLGLPSFVEAIVAGLLMSYGLWLATPVIFAYLLAQGFQEAITGMAGPIGIVAMGNQAVQASPTIGALLMNAAWFFALINVGLAGFNLLPLYPLDGGHVADLIMGKILGKRAEPVQKVYRIACVAAFLVLVVLIFALDILKVVAGRVPGP